MRMFTRTLAYLLPMLLRLLSTGSRGPFGLVLVPTRVSRAENEDTLTNFLRSHTEFSQASVKSKWGFERLHCWMVLCKAGRSAKENNHHLILSWGIGIASCCLWQCSVGQGWPGWECPSECISIFWVTKSIAFSEKWGGWWASTHFALDKKTSDKGSAFSLSRTYGGLDRHLLVNDPYVYMYIYLLYSGRMVSMIFANSLL